MTKKLLLLLCFFSLTTLTSSAQEKYTLSGVVKDAKSGELLFGATVYFNESKSGTVTNEYGFYSITAPTNTYTVFISYLGYQSKEINLELNANTTLNFQLEESADQLEEVVVTSTNSKTINLRSPQMSVSKLTTSTIKEIPVVLGETDVVKAIQLLPGVSNTGEGSSGFNVRGGASDQNLVLLDEAVIYNASHLFGFFSVFNADAIKDIKLYKGGIPAQFGGRVSSVLDIRQKDGNNQDFHMNGGIGAVAARLLLEGPIEKDKGSFLVAGRGSYGHLFLKASGNKNSAYFYDLNLKGNYTLSDKNRLYVSGYFGNDVFDFGDAFNNSYGNSSANLRWNHLFSDKLFSNLSLIFSKYNYNLNLNFIKLDWKSDITNYNLKYDLTHYLSERIKLLYGLNSIYYQFNPGEVFPSTSDSSISYRKLQDKTALESALYLMAEHKLSDKFTVQYGARLSHFNRLGPQRLNTYTNDLGVVYNSQLGIYESAVATGQETFASGKGMKSFINLEPRVALSYQLNDQTALKANYNRTTQYIHLISNTVSATPLDVWAPSGKYIEPQLADQVAVGYYRTFKDNTYALEVESYYKTVQNRLDYIDGADLIAQENIETQLLSGEARAYGLEVLLRKNKGNLKGWLAYTLARSEQRTLGGANGGPGINAGNWYKTPYDRTHDISLTGSYRFNDKWSVGTNFIFQTGRPVTYPNGQYQYLGFSMASYDARNANRLPAYHRVDVSVTLKPRKNANRKWKAEWVFGIYNLYNRRNAASISFQQNFDTGRNEATRTAIFGIVPSVTYNFKF